MKRGGRIRREYIMTYLFMTLLIGGGIILLYFFNGGFTGYAVYEQLNQLGFDEGVYNNTEWNGSAIVLSLEQTSGTYTSKLFDAGVDASWNNLTWQGGIIESSDSFLISASHLDVNRTDIFVLDDIYYLADMKDSSKNFYFNFSKNLVNNTVLKLYAKKNKGSIIGIYTHSDVYGENPLGTFIVDSAIGEWYNINLKIETTTNAIWIGEVIGSGTDPKDEFDYLYAEVPGNNLTFQVRNCSTSDCSDGTWQTTDLSKIDLVSRYFQYKIVFTTPDYNVTPLIESVSVDYTILNSAPAITLISPQDGATYGYNESIVLDFVVSDSEGNLDSCWYNVNNGENISLIGCANTSFNVSEDGGYILTIYANDTQGEEVTDSITFSVQIGAPSIELGSSIYVYLNHQEDIYLNYIPIDMDLDSCELWGDFTGTFSLNQTDFSPISGSKNTFSLTLSSGVYLWNIQCNDTQGNYAMSGNKTLYIDTINPSLSLTEPTGVKSSRTISAEWSVYDDNLDSCWYNVYRGVNVEISNTIVNCLSNSTSFDVTVDADFILNFYINDSAGNSNFANLSFSVGTLSSIPSPPSSSGGGSGGGSYSSGGGSIIIPRKTELTTDKIQNLIVNSGDVKKLNLVVKNTGTNFLNDCKFKSTEESSVWITYIETKNLAAGEEYDFVFNLNVPEIIEAGQYDLGVVVECNEIIEFVNFTAEIIEKKLDFDLIKVERVTKEQVKIIYQLEELSGIEQNIELQFLLFGSNNEKIAEVKENKTISANLKEEFEILIPIDSSLNGELSLLINLNSEVYSTFVQEDIILGASISGFSVFGEIGNTDNVLSSAFAILFLVFAFFMIRKILKHRKKTISKKKKLLKK